MNMSPQAQYEMAKKLPKEELIAIMRGKPSTIDMAVAMSALKSLMQTQTALQGQAAQGEASQPSVKDQLMTGVAQLPAPNMESVASAQGGIAGFADGGDVQAFADGGAAYGYGMDTTVGLPPAVRAQLMQMTPEEREAATKQLAPYLTAAAAAPVVAAAAAPFIPAAGQAARAAFAPAMNTTARVPGSVPLSKEAWRVVQTKPAGVLRFPGQVAASAAAAGGAGMGLDTLINARQREEANAGRPEAKDDMFTPFASKIGYTKVPLMEGEFGPAEAPTTKKAAAGKGTGAARKAVAAGQGAPKMPAPEVPTAVNAPTEQSAGLTATPPPELGLEEYYNKIKAASQPYMDSATEALKALTDSPEEKDARGEKRKGIMALKAAQELMTGGRGAAASRGAALGKVGDLVQEYTKEDDASKRAEIGARINLLSAQANIAQGNMKAGIDLLNHGQNLTQRYAQMEAEKVYRSEMVKLQGRRLSEQERHNLALEKAQQRQLDIMDAYRKAQANAMGGKADAVESRERIAILNNAVKSLTEQLRGAIGPERKTLSAELTQLYRALLQEGGIELPAPVTGLMPSLPQGAQVLGSLKP